MNPTGRAVRKLALETRLSAFGHSRRCPEPDEGSFSGDGFNDLVGHSESRVSKALVKRQTSEYFDV